MNKCIVENKNVIVVFAMIFAEMKEIEKNETNEQIENLKMRFLNLSSNLMQSEMHTCNKYVKQ